MYRFQTSPQRIPGKKLWVSLLLFLFLILLFTLGTSSLSENTVRRQKESLTQALNRDITYCYATTGRYPETLEAIKKDYGLIYDDSLFFVDYRTQAHDLTQASRRAGDVAELITASTSPDDMKNLLEDAYSDAVNIASENFTIFYDSDFIPCSQETAVWQLSGTWNLNGQLLDVQLDVTKLTSGVEADVFYQLPVRHHLQRRNGS